MPPTTRVDPEVPRIDCYDVLKTQRDGDCKHEIDLELTRAVTAVRDTGKAATVSIVLTVAPGAVGNGEKVGFKDRVTSKLPRHDYAPNLYYTTEDGGITRHNPRQLTMTAIVGEGNKPAAAASTSRAQHPAVEN